MNNNDFGLDFSIDDILSEFTESSAARTGSLADESLPQPPEREEPAPESEYDFSAEETAVYTTVPPEPAEDKITRMVNVFTPRNPLY